MTDAKFCTPSLLPVCVALLFSGQILTAPAQEPAARTDAAPVVKPTPPRLRGLDFSPFRSAMEKLTPTRSAELGEWVLKASVAEVQSALAAGKCTSQELTLFFLSRIERQDEALRSYLEINPRCLEEAREADRRRAGGKTLSPLDGIPLNLKDNIGTTAPLHTTAGAEILLTHSPAKDATLVRRLREAGAVVLGKASLSELAGSLTTKPPGYNAISGIGVNAYRKGLPVSGSSSGSGISTNAGLTMVSIGTETSGSLIAPGACNGVVAMKPGLGVVSGEGIVPLIRFQDSAGPVTRRVADAALLLGVMDEKDTDYTAALKPDALAGVAVGVLRASLTGKSAAGSNTEWLRRIDEGLRKAKTVPVDVPDTFQGKTSILPLIFLGLQVDTLGYIAATGSAVKTIADLKAYNTAKPDTRIPLGENMIDMAVPILPALLEELKATPGTQDKAYEEMALDLRRQMSARLDEAFRTAKVEILVSLANAHSDLYATAGYPAISVPLGLDQDGTPNGVTFIGKPGQDAALLGYAFAFEQATHYRVTPPADGL